MNFLLPILVFGFLFSSPDSPDRGTSNPEGDFLKEFNSVYGTILIRRQGNIVEMYATYKGWMARESGVDLSCEETIVVPYVRYLFAGSLVAPDPEKVLVIGMGGGGFNRFFNLAYPKAELTSVEIDRRVVELAKEYMDFQEADRNRVAIRDGRSFLRRNREKFDWIILDAFHGSVVPPHLKTRDFYREAASHLTENGILLSNIHDDSELFYFDLATFRSAFSDVVMLKVPGTGNVIVLANDGPPGTIESRLRSGEAVAGLPALWKKHLDPADFREAVMSFSQDDLERGRVMTDDFAPAEYYRILPARSR